MKCEKCGVEPFGVESWFTPRGANIGEDLENRTILCPDCYCKKHPEMPKPLNITEKIEGA